MAEKTIPTLEDFIGTKRPNFFYDERTPEDLKGQWFRAKEESYYELYGKEPIESLRFKKESE